MKRERKARGLTKASLPATRAVLEEVIDKWDWLEEADEALGGAPAAGQAAEEMFDKWVAFTDALQATRRRPAEISSRFTTFIAHAFVFAKSYGENVYWPTVASAGRALVGPKHDVERPALRLVKPPAPKKRAAGKKKGDA